MRKKVTISVSCPVQIAEWLTIQADNERLPLSVVAVRYIKKGLPIAVLEGLDPHQKYSIFQLGAVLWDNGKEGKSCE